MQDGIYRIIFYAKGYSPTNDAPVEKIDYVAFMNDENGNAFGIGVIPSELTPLKFATLEKARELEISFEAGHLSKIGVNKPLDKISLQDIAPFPPDVSGKIERVAGLDALVL